MVTKRTIFFNNQYLMQNFLFEGLIWFSASTAIISLNTINQLIFVMEKCGVFCELRKELLDII
jgi:hypothetical protein